VKFFLKYWIPISVLATLMASELTLRLAFGLGKPVLSQADTFTGYRFQPNQKVLRFGKEIQYNQYSQRSEPLSSEKPKGMLRILMTGDSVLNGGNPTDQKKTITELLEAQLSTSRQPAEVLNASAGSWGIGNQLGYLRKFGMFQSDAVILQIGTHDLTQSTSTSAPVGHHPAFPTHPPLLAIQEAFTRYFQPKLLGAFKLNSSPARALHPSYVEANHQFKQNMENLEAILTLVRGQHIPVFVLFTPSQDELLPTYHIPQKKAQFFQLLNSTKIPVIDAHTAWSTLPATTVKAYFRDSRDNYHLSEAGNQALANLLFQKLCIAYQLTACLNSSGG